MINIHPAVLSLIIEKRKMEVLVETTTEGALKVMEYKESVKLACYV